MEARRPSRPRLLLFAFGDFAFNLYWQSIMLFLLFYYTDALELPIGVASTTYLIASVWDGIASFVVGILVDRRHATLRYGAILIAGAIPLGLCFMLTYMPPLTTGTWAIASILGAHLLFRTAYAAVNVPYLAMTARISADTDDRAFVAGTRMLFGTAAAVTVALVTVPVGRWLTGSTASEAYFGAAVLFAVVGTAILMFVGATYREATTIERPMPGSVRAALVSLARNRAFVTLSAAMMAMIVIEAISSISVNPWLARCREAMGSHRFSSRGRSALRAQVRVDGSLVRGAAHDVVIHERGLETRGCRLRVLHPAIGRRTGLCHAVVVDGKAVGRLQQARDARVVRIAEREHHRLAGDLDARAAVGTVLRHADAMRHVGRAQQRTAHALDRSDTCLFFEAHELR